ncbi:hypothetical protein ACIA8O_03070 [Kitasatospora sp. NPDC051853]|uniref:hypothetical protein n=1 Tax=Kitasatospora sp. NPDC051853 TaxID=3364058 RepID=UPI0037A22766
MLVMVEAVPAGLPLVRVRSAVGTAVVVWRGADADVGREHHVEWTLDEEIAWGRNAHPAASTTPALRDEDGHVVLRGVLGLDEDGGATLGLAGTHVLLGLPEPAPPADAGGTWAEVRIAREHAEVWPFEV